MNKRLWALAVLVAGTLAFSPIASWAANCEGEPVSQTGCSGGIGNTCEGTSGNDLMKGNDSANVMNALGASDQLEGFGGDDRICEATGPQYGNIAGDGGNDELYGQQDRDTIWAGNGADKIFGQEYDDDLSDGFGLDDLDGGSEVFNPFGDVWRSCDDSRADNNTEIEVVYLNEPCHDPLP